MEITEVRIKLVENGNERLRAFCSITLDGDFVIRDLKIIDGVSGPFVAMPSRKLMDRCQRCGSKNHLRARFCNECGAKLNENRAPKDAQGRAKLHADVAHPINAACRERMQKAVVQAYTAELEKAKAPDYRPAALDDYDDMDYEVPASESHEPQAKRLAPAEPAEPAEAAAAPRKDDAFSDYNALIADLKRDAQQRRPPSRGDRAPAGPPPEPAPHRGDVPEKADRPPEAGPAPRLAPPAATPPPAPPGPEDDFGSGL